MPIHLSRHSGPRKPCWALSGAAPEPTDSPAPLGLSYVPHLLPPAPALTTATAAGLATSPPGRGTVTRPPTRLSQRLQRLAACLSESLLHDLFGSTVLMYFDDPVVTATLPCT